MDGFLHFRLEILNAHAEAVEAEAAQGFEVRAAGDARVDFDSDFGVGREGKSLARVAEEIFHLRGREIRRRAAAPVELDHGALFRDHAADVFDFAFQRGEVGRR